jgi:glycosyltransferase involved in cell wall biosynthesis
VLVLASTYPRWPGDTEPGFVHELCRRLASRFDVQVLSPHAPGARTQEVMDGVEVRRFRYLPGRLETLAYEGGIPEKLRRQPWRLLQVPFFLAGLLWAAWRALRTRKFDAIHAHWLLPQGFVAALFKAIDPAGPPLVVTLHGADLYTANSAPVRAVKRRALGQADAVTVVSEAMRREVEALGADPARTSVLSMGVDTESRFVPGQGPRRAGTLLFAGRLVEKKGARYAIEALALLRRERPGARLVVAGDGPERPVLEARVRELGLEEAVTFLGAVPQPRLAELYREAAAAVFPFVVAKGGDREGLGLVVVEAQSCGCPVIAADVPAVHDTVTDGETGLLVPPGDPAALAAAMRQVLDDAALAERLGAAGPAAAARFSWTRIAEGYARVIGKAMGRA